MNYNMGPLMPEYAHQMMDHVVRQFYDKNVHEFDKNLRFLSREGVTPRLHIYIPVGIGEDYDTSDHLRWTSSSPMVTLQYLN